MAERGVDVRFLVPRTAWCDGDLDTPCEIVRFRYAPRIVSSLSGKHGILENVRERPLRAALFPAFWVGLGLALRRHLRAYRPDLVAAHMLLPAGWIVARECRNLGIPFELFGHGTDVDVLMRLPAWLRHLFAERARHARTIHLPSAEKLARFAAAIPLSEQLLHIETMRHCVPAPATWLRPRPSLGAPPKVLYMGRLIRQKGVDDLLAAVAQMEPRPQLQVAGDGPERRRLEHVARALGVDATFHGFVHGEAKDRLFRHAAVVCVPSREVGPLSEGAPLVVVEALAYDVPVVATHVGGIPELCRGSGSATLVPPGDPDALARALGALAGWRPQVRSAS
jgi:glycosyltransferase involved in cell wall biosynthesis